MPLWRESTVVSWFPSEHDDVIKWKHFPRYWPFVWVPGEFPAQSPVARSFDVFFDLYPNKRLSKQWWGWWFETPSRPLWHHHDEEPIVQKVKPCQGIIIIKDKNYISRDLLQLHVLSTNIQQHRMNTIEEMLAIVKSVSSGKTDNATSSWNCQQALHKCRGKSQLHFYPNQISPFRVGNRVGFSVKGCSMPTDHTV